MLTRCKNPPFQAGLQFSFPQRLTQVPHSASRWHCTLQRILRFHSQQLFQYIYFFFLNFTHCQSRTFTPLILYVPVLISHLWLLTYTLISVFKCHAPFPFFPISLSTTLLFYCWLETYLFPKSFLPQNANLRYPVFRIDFADFLRLVLPLQDVFFLMQA